MFRSKNSGKKYNENQHGESVYLETVTILDAAMGWIEICKLSLIQADFMLNQVEISGYSRYPLPIKVIADCGNLFLVELKTMIQANCGIKIKPITSRNPQANFLLETVHQTMGDVLRTFKVEVMVLNNENPWVGILASSMFSLCAMVHTKT